MDNKDVMLTTIDNPFNPFTDYNAWYAYDVAKGHHTCAYLSRVAMSSSLMSKEDEDDAIIEAMEEIVSMDPNNKYIIVGKDNFETRIKPVPAGAGL